MSKTFMNNFIALLKLELRPPRGVCEAHLHLAGKRYVIGTIPTHSNGSVMGML